MLDYHILQQRILSQLTFAINLLNNDNGVVFVYIFLCLHYSKLYICRTDSVIACYKKLGSQLQVSLLAVFFSLIVLVRRRVVVWVPFDPFCLDGRLVLAALGVLIAALTAVV
jgi:hypothetical protein